MELTIQLGGSNESKPMSVCVIERSDTGDRLENQDALGWRSVGDWLICVLADGAGGHRGGEVASTFAVNALLDEFSLAPTADSDLLLTITHRVNQGILDLQKSQAGLEDMHSTLCAMVLNQKSGQAIWLHVGDSRVYHFQNEVLASRTKDHSVLQWMADNQPAEPIPARNALYTALGEKAEQLQVEISRPCGVLPGDWFLLCSDGLWEHFTDAELALLGCSLQHDSTCVEHIHHLALTRANGRADNLSSILVFVDGV